MADREKRKRTPQELAEMVEALAARGTMSQEFGMSIDREGRWYHQGEPIQRRGLVKLFASALTRLDNGEYWLVTPAERGRIDVEDTPFVITKNEIKGQGRDALITLYTNLDEKIPLNAEHPIRMRGDESERPYVALGGNLEARIGRAVFYDLAAMAETDTGRFVLWSHGTGFDLGSTEDRTQEEAE